MKTSLKNSLESMASGLFMMTIFTAAWIGLAEYNLQGRDYGSIGLLFLIILCVFVRYYFKFNNVARSLHGPLALAKSAEEKKRDKWFMIICSLEGVAIFLTANILINLKLYNYFIPSMALIVGLHFFPLAYLFKRSFDYFSGTWTCLIAILGIFLTKNQTPYFIIVAVVGTGCAFATTAHGLKMIVKGRSDIQQSAAD